MWNKTSNALDASRYAANRGCLQSLASAIASEIIKAVLIDDDCAKTSLEPVKLLLKDGLCGRYKHLLKQLADG